MFRTVSDCLYFSRRNQPAKTGIQFEKCFGFPVQRLLSSTWSQEPGEFPVGHHGCRRDREDLGGFFDAEATEDASLARVVLGEGV